MALLVNDGMARHGMVWNGHGNELAGLQMSTESMERGSGSV